MSWSPASISLRLTTIDPGRRRGRCGRRGRLRRQDRPFLRLRHLEGPLLIVDEEVDGVALDPDHLRPGDDIPRLHEPLFPRPLLLDDRKPVLGSAGDGSLEIDEQRDILLLRQRGGLLVRNRLGRRPEEVPLRDHPVGIRRFADGNGRRPGLLRRSRRRPHPDELERQDLVEDPRPLEEDDGHHGEDHRPPGDEPPEIGQRQMGKTRPVH